jgi:hypothetical protein
MASTIGRCEYQLRAERDIFDRLSFAVLAPITEQSHLPRVGGGPMAKLRRGRAGKHAKALALRTPTPDKRMASRSVCATYRAWSRCCRAWVSRSAHVLVGRLGSRRRAGLPILQQWNHGQPQMKSPHRSFLVPRDFHRRSGELARGEESWARCGLYRQPYQRQEVGT